MLTSDFDYPLPPRAIAQPPARRDRSRMLVLDRASGHTEHHTIRDLPAFLQRGDCIVVNDTKVFRARLRAVVERRSDGAPLCPSVASREGGSPPVSEARRSGGAPSPPVHQEGKTVELLLIRPAPPASSRESPRAEGSRSISEWLVLAKPARRLRVGASVAVGRMRGTVLGHEPDGSVRIQFDRSAAAVIAHANRIGEVPVPPYVVHGTISPPPSWRGRSRGGGAPPGFEKHNHSDWKQSGIRLQDYQTTYARHTGSVAAPTAGFHITPRLLRALNKRGVHVARITLHVGLGTFQPIRTEKLEDHTMHAEWVSIPATTARAITSTKSRGSRVVAIGTTTLRALEGVALVEEGRQRSLPLHLGGGDKEGVARHHDSNSNAERIGVGRNEHGQRSSVNCFVSLFITPGFRFQVVDALLTNFHLPRSTLLVLVSAFAAPGNHSLHGRDMILRAYRSALRHGYRFYSFGDAMLIQG